MVYILSYEFFGDGTMLITLDRIEGGWAVFESPEGEIRLKASMLPAGAREGDVFFLEDGRLSFSPEETEKSRSRANDLFRSLFEE